VLTVPLTLTGTTLPGLYVRDVIEIRRLHLLVSYNGNTLAL
jgi:hypothetical protein